MPNRRAAERRAARIKVRFWRSGTPEKVFIGYTTNVSDCGCFIQTDQPVRTTGRLQLEFTTEAYGFVCEGIVARSMKAPYELRQVKPSGMGVRFLTIPELLQQVAPSVLPAKESASEALLQGEPKGSESLEPQSSQPNSVHRSTSAKDRAGRASTPAARAKKDESLSEFETTSDASKRAARMHPAAAPRKTHSAGKTEESAEPVAAFRIAPPSVAHLDKLYRSHLRKNRLFIPTTKDYKPGAKVRVELVLPESERAVELYGRVLPQKQGSRSTREPTPSAHGLQLELEQATSAVKTVGSYLSEKHRSS